MQSLLEKRRHFGALPQCHFDALLNELLDAGRGLRDRGRTALLVEHDMKVVLGLCEVVFVLDHGEKLAEGPLGVI